MDTLRELSKIYKSNSIPIIVVYTRALSTPTIKEMEKFRPDVVFIGLGAPKQEFFMRDNMERMKKCGIKYAVGSGGTVDFVSGKINRAPKWVSKLGLEGFYRLFKEFNKARFKRLTYSFKFFKYIWKKPKFKKQVIKCFVHL